MSKPFSAAATDSSLRSAPPLLRCQLRTPGRSSITWSEEAPRWPLCASTSDKPAAGKGSSSRSQASRGSARRPRSEEHTSELQSLAYLVCRLLLEKKKKQISEC